MSDDEKRLVYVVLGAMGSGRREVVADLIEGGVAAEDHPVVLLSENEPPDPVDSRLGTTVRWSVIGEENFEIAAELPAEARIVFFIADGRANPVDQIEWLRPWMAGQGLELGRVLTVMHCQLASEHKRLLAWYDACVHFSDVLLLHRREGVPNKWFSELKSRLHKLCLPTLIETVKKGRVANPALVLDPQARRVSHWFDEADEWTSMIDADTEIVIEDDEGEELEDGEMDELDYEDPYLARHSGGRRKKEIPNVRDFLSSSNE